MAAAQIALSPPSFTALHSLRLHLCLIKTNEMQNSLRFTSHILDSNQAGCIGLLGHRLTGVSKPDQGRFNKVQGTRGVTGYWVTGYGLKVSAAAPRSISGCSQYCESVGICRIACRPPISASTGRLTYNQLSEPFKMLRFEPN